MLWEDEDRSEFTIDTGQLRNETTPIALMNRIPYNLIYQQKPGNAHEKARLPAIKYPIRVDADHN